MAARNSKTTNETKDVTGNGPDKPPPGCPVVGIGASAGGIDALKKFLPAIDPQSGLCFVLVQHLDPNHESILPDILAPFSPVPVVRIQEGTEAEPNHFYVIPSNAALTIENGRLHLSRLMKRRAFGMPIDTFFISLAEDRGGHAACAILSGTGSDGTLGLRAIKEHGGLTLAQAGAEYDGMMRSALSTGLVDFVLPADEMPAKLAGYFSHLNEIMATKGPEGAELEATDAFAQICGLLRARTGHDFSGYKNSTIARRVQRRMQVLQIDTIAAFLARLREDAREVDLLFQDFLIGVTNFFRDPKIFEAVQREIMPRIFEGKGANDEVRVWVPGCSTGEEAYTIAILLKEHARRLETSPKLQIFASDIDEHGLELARLGRFPGTIAKDVPEPLLERYFQHEEGTYRITGGVREICLFAAHNLLRDPPFSRLDLISCRNLLIYLNADTQNRLIPLFHYALREGGFVLLGSSEGIGRHAGLFFVIDKANRIYRRRPQAIEQLPDFPLVSRNVARQRQPVRLVTQGSAAAQVQAERLLVERYLPAYVIVNAHGDVVHSSARTGKYLELPSGPPSANIFGMARRGLRLDLRAALHRAIESSQPIVQSNVNIDMNGGMQLINLIAQPLAEDGREEALYMVAFQDLATAQPAGDGENAEPEDGTRSATLRELEANLHATRERLQTTTEELQSSNEELQSANEELQSSNEELQSANEELETSKEELQSVNEELQTVNAELKARVDELSRANSDIANLLEVTQIATVFLDQDLTIKSFTPAAKDIFYLVETDSGRPFTHIRSRLALDSLSEDAERVLRTLVPVEKQVETSDGAKRYMMRILPYRTVQNVIAGVVINYVDVTRITNAEAEISNLTRQLRERVEALERILDIVPAGVFIAGHDPATNVQVNRYGLRILGEEWTQRGPRDVPVPYRLFKDNRELAFWEQPLQRAAAAGQAIAPMEGRLERADGALVDVMATAEPLLDESGAPRGAVGVIVDVSERKRAEEHQTRLMHELQHRVKNLLASVSAMTQRMAANSEDIRTIQDFAAALNGRIMALGGLQEVLSKNVWQSVDLAQIIAAVMQPYTGSGRGGGKLSISGPSIMLASSPATTLGMALHELATNAAKYGALSVPQGSVDVSWEIRSESQGRRLLLFWTERNGPPITAFPTRGFGSRFIVDAISYELDGVARLSFHPEGVRCSIEFPLPETPQAAGSDGTSPSG
jgi:two-component system CheB/CheR fusion protein